MAIFKKNKRITVGRKVITTDESITVNLFADDVYLFLKGDNEQTITFELLREPKIGYLPINVYVKNLSNVDKTIVLEGTSLTITPGHMYQYLSSYWEPNE